MSYKIHEKEYSTISRFFFSRPEISKLWYLKNISRTIRDTVMILSFRTDSCWLVVLRLNVPVNNFSVMSGRSDRQVWANSADPGQTRSSLIRAFTVCNSLCIFWMHYSKETPSYSTFRVITTNFLGVRIFRKFTVEQIRHQGRAITRCFPSDDKQHYGNISVLTP